MNHPKSIVVAQMQPRMQREWKTDTPDKKKKYNKRLLRKSSVLAAACLCLGVGAFLTLQTEQGSRLASHLTAGFDYDESLGRLQFVSNILPQSAMVFLSSNLDHSNQITAPVSAPVTHTWSGEEPWFEYTGTGDVLACMAGEVMTVIKNRQDAYTVRILHENGYESVYSGLNHVAIDEHDWIEAGKQIGSSASFTAFEFRKDGLSVLPTFAQE